MDKIIPYIYTSGNILFVIEEIVMGGMFKTGKKYKL